MTQTLTFKEHIDNLKVNIKQDLAKELSPEIRKIYDESLDYAANAIKILDMLEKLDLNVVLKKHERNKDEEK